MEQVRKNEVTGKLIRALLTELNELEDRNTITGEDLCEILVGAAQGVVGYLTDATVYAIKEQLHRALTYIDVGCSIIEADDEEAGNQSSENGEGTVKEGDQTH